MQILSTSELVPSNFSRELEGKDCGRPGLSLILVDAAPGAGPSLHTHPYAEIMIIQSGTATFTDGTTSREVGPGHVVVIGAGEPHAFTNTGEERCTKSTSTLPTRSPPTGCDPRDRQPLETVHATLYDTNRNSGPPPPGSFLPHLEAISGPPPVESDGMGLHD